MSIEVKNLVKTFGAYTAVNGISLKVEPGELVALLGPSGCGKTTLLRMIAGLETADSGQILLNGEDVTALSVREKKVGFVFQHYALFRRMTVFENVAFGLRVLRGPGKPSRQQITERVNHLLAMVQMDWAGGRMPSQLSGGQRQRVALARALATEPRVLLLDEPFSALDAKVRLELRRWLRKLHDELHITSVFVTHDQEEALELADRIVVVNKGAIEQQGTPEEVYDNPASAFVHNFLGNVNVFHRRTHDGSASVGFVRPHDVVLGRVRGKPTDLEGVIVDARIRGRQVAVEVSVPGHERSIEAEIDREAFKALGVAPGDSVFVDLEAITEYVEDYSI